MGDGEGRLYVADGREDAVTVVVAVVEHTITSDE